ncbi:MAG: glycogen synthase GlgA [Thiohalomonadales bacterium]
MGLEKNDYLIPESLDKILYVASEAYPLIKTGGLGDVAGSLPIALAKQGCDIRILLPYYSILNKKFKKTKIIATVSVNDREVNIIESIFPGTRIKIWCCDYAPYFKRNGTPYTDLNGEPWSDNALRFDLFCKVAVLLACNQLNLDWHADVVHCNDWQTGLIPVYLQQYPTRPACIFTIHNLAYQGLFSREIFNELELNESLWTPDALEFYGQMSFIKGGLVFADQINTVSPNYANEIQTEQFGYGLDGLLRYKRDKLSGILNGIDTRFWHPWHDPFLYVNYNNKSLDIKHTNKITVQTMFNFPKDKEKFVIGMVSRIIEQKGFEQIIAALPKLSELPIQLLILGCGDRHYESKLINLAKQYSKTFSVKIGYSENIAHMVTAGVDAFLMPSTFEPCGLSQMYSLRYGTLPIVRNVGGLSDTVNDYVFDKKKVSDATGFVIREHEDLISAITRSYETYLNKPIWLKLQRNAMRKDFSWQRSASEYIKLYNKANEINLQPMYVVQ